MIRSDAYVNLSEMPLKAEFISPFSLGIVGEKDSVRSRIENLKKENAQIGSAIDDTARFIMREVKDKYQNPRDYADYLISEFFGLSFSENETRNHYSHNILIDKKDAFNAEIKANFQEVFAPLVVLIHDIELRADDLISPFLTNFLGDCFKDGLGIVKDQNYAFALYQKSSSSLPQARYNLGLCYENGIGIEKNLDEALQNYRAAANEGKNCLAQRAVAKILGTRFLDDKMTYPKRISKQKKYLEEAAKHHYPAAQFDLANLYRNENLSIGMFFLESKSEEKALELYKLAAIYGHQEAEQFALELERKMLSSAKISPAEIFERRIKPSSKLYEARLGEEFENSKPKKPSSIFPS